MAAGPAVVGRGREALDGFLGDGELDLQALDLLALGGELLAQQHQREDVAGLEPVTPWAYEFPAHEPPAGPAPLRAGQVAEQHLDRQVLATRDRHPAGLPAVEGFGVDVELKAQARFADAFDGGAQIAPRAGVDFQHGVKFPLAAAAASTPIPVRIMYRTAGGEVPFYQ